MEASSFDAPPPPPPVYYDRSTGLIVFGILTILLGCVCGLLAVVTPLSQLVVPADQRVDFGQLLPALGLYAIMAVALIWLGVGSILAYRWARALLLIFSWSWLVIGLIEMVTLPFFLPKSLAMAPQGHAALPPGATAAVVLITCVVVGIFFVALPGSWVFFYRSSHVKATCEWRHPALSWTDRCPLPVLGLVLWLWVSLPLLVLMPLGGHMVMPFFGLLVTGLPAAAICYLMAGTWLIAGSLMYQLDVRGWWLVLIGILLGSASSLLTFSLHDFTEIYPLMHYPQSQIDLNERSGMFKGNAIIWIMTLSFTPFLIYLVVIKRYFRRPSA